MSSPRHLLPADPKASFVAHEKEIRSAIDRVLALMALLALSPLLLTVAAAIKLDSHGPVLFRQPRQGLGDTLFDVFKFRSMHQDLGDAVHERDLPQLNHRDIDIDSHPAERSGVPRVGLPAGTVQNPFAERPDQPHPLGDRDEFDGAEVAEAFANSSCSQKAVFAAGRLITVLLG